MEAGTNEPNRKTALLTFPAFGAILLSLLSIPQKIALGIDLSAFEWFATPIVGGALAGLALGWLYEKNKNNLIEKQDSLQSFDYKSRLIDELAASIPGIVYQFKIDSEGVRSFPYISPGVTDATGVAAATIANAPQGLFNLVAPEDRDALNDSIEKSHADLTPWHWEGRLQNHAGTHSWFRGSASPRRTPDGATIWNGALFEITDLKKAKAELRAAKENLEETVVERTNELNFQKRALDEHAIVSVTDANGNITYANRKFCDISGYSQDELVGNNHRVLKSGYHDDAYYSEMWQTIASGHVWHGDIQNKAKDGSFHWFRATIVPFLDGRGKPFQYIAIRTDITERKAVEYELENAKEMAERARYDAESANLAKSKFLSSMSHELRTPLNAIIGFGQLLKEGTGDMSVGQKEEYLEHILVAGSHLLKLIDQVLELAKIESGALNISLDNLSPVEEIKIPIAISSAIAANAGILLTNSCIDGDIPNIAGDRIRFRQVLLNFLSNAIKYNRADGKVTLDCKVIDNRYVRFLVTDTGYGIPKEQREQLFQPFQRLEKTHSTIKGTGIGLAISKELVEKMGGNLGCESTVGEGSTFWFELPIASGPAAIEPVSPPAAAPVAGDIPLRPDGRDVSILYVEDNPVNVILMKKIFGRFANVEVFETRTAEEGLGAIEKNMPDVVLMDIDLPGMNGKEACQILKRQPSTKHLPVIAVSAHAFASDVSELMTFGFDAYVRKPFVLSELTKVVADAIAASN